MAKRRPDIRGPIARRNAGTIVVDADDAILTRLNQFISTRGNDIIATRPPITNPTVNAGQSFAVPINASNGFQFGTVLTTGSTPDGFTIDGSDIDIDSSGVLSKTGTLTVGSTTRNVQALLSTASYTSPSVEISIVVEPKSYSVESGDNLVINATAWNSDQSVSVGDRRSNAGKFYEATSAGTTGSTAPTHTTGSASDGSVTWLFLTTINYTSFSSWTATLSSSLSAPRTAIVWNSGAEITSSTSIISISGITTTAINRITIKAKAEDAFFSSSSPALRYDATKGVAMSTTGGYDSCVNISTQYFTIEGLMIKGLYKGLVASSGVTEGIISRCIIQADSDNYAAHYRGIAKNSIFIKNHAGTSNYAILGEGGPTLVNCTVVRPSNLTSGGVALGSSYGTFTVRNTIIGGFTTAPVGAFSGNNNSGTNTTSVPGTSPVSISTMSGEFVNPSMASPATADFRIQSGAVSRNVGAVAPTNADTFDVFGTSRGGAWDIGAHEYV